VPLLYRTSDAAFAQAAVDALLKRGIDAYATGTGGGARGAADTGPAEFSIFVRSAADTRRATRILSHLGAAPPRPARAAPPRWLVWAVVLAVVLLAMLLALNFGGH